MSEELTLSDLKKKMKPRLKTMSKNQLIDIIIELGAEVTNYKAALAVSVNNSSEETNQEQSND